MFKNLLKELRSINSVQKNLVLADAVVAPMTISVLEKHLAELQRRYPQTNSQELTYAEQEWARRADGKIQAIKAVRERTRLGLKEAKDLVEAWMQKNLGFTYHPRGY
jgi:ribosomal protein L7/L12